MNPLDLIRNPATGKLSHTKLWANIACAVASYKFATISGCQWEVWGMYLGCVGGYAAARRYLSAKVQIKEIEHD